MTADIQTALAGLQAFAAAPPGRDELGRLAQGRVWCQQLGDAAPDRLHATGGATAQTLARQLGVLLERLILGELTQPDDAVRLVSDAAAGIWAAVQGEACDAAGLAARLAAAVGPTPCIQALAPEAWGPRVAEPTPERKDAVGPAADTYVSEPLLLDLSEREHLEGFLAEAGEHLDTIEASVLAVEADPTAAGKINELFRPFHTIKGIAGFLNLRDIQSLAHEIESILDLGRRNELAMTAAITDLVFAGVDVLQAQLRAIRQYLAEPTGGPCPQPPVADIIARLRAVTRLQLEAPAAAAMPQPRLGEILTARETVTPGEVERALDDQARDPPPPRRLGQVLVDRGVATPGQVARALTAQAAGEVALDHTLRVDTRKLDTLVDAVGELVIAQSMVTLAAGGHPDERLQRAVLHATKIVRAVQSTSLAMRMVPIGQLFQKMKRLVRDVARKAGKQVALVTAGEETELDKTVIQQVSDPLVHMVRNAIDHGLEAPADRRAAGKPETGTVTLSARHEGDSIVIEIRDDGRGLDRQRLIAKAVERGLLASGQDLTDAQAFDLILQPGFSTAEVVTDLSGRGVGMDVVRRNIEQLRGQLEISSESGRGSTFRVRLPLTLAIIDGMLVRVGRDRLIIPTVVIQHALRPLPDQLVTVQRRGTMLRVRDTLYPLVQLGVLLGPGDPIDPCAGLVVIVQCPGQKLALVVEELLGQQQVVIKTLEQRFQRIAGVSGAAILGDGRVALILDPAGLLALHAHGGGQDGTRTEAACRAALRAAPAGV